MRTNARASQMLEPAPSPNTTRGSRPRTVVAVVMIYDGLTGPKLAPQNLATVAAWVHYRGLVVLALLLAGNLFCMSCPFTLPRTLAHRLSSRGRRW